MRDKDFEILIKNSLEEKTKYMDVSPFMLQKIKQKASNECGKETKRMKIFSLKKLVVVGILCVSSVTCFAALKLGGVSSSSTKEFTSLSEMDRVEDKIGFSPKYVENFENGFTFKEGYVGETVGNDTEGNEMGKTYKLVSFGYEDKDGNTLTLMAENGNQLVDFGGEYVEGYDTQIFKFVPPGYKLTEEDKKLESEGKIAISYGSPEVEIQTAENYSWEEDGIYYSLVAFDCNFGEEQMEKMVEEIKG